MCVTVIAGIVTFFPTLVNVTLALRATPQASIDLFRAYGAGPLKTMRKVQLPNALPAIFASLRIAAPLALVGALLAEWLATGHGLGYLMLQSSIAVELQPAVDGGRARHRVLDDPLHARSARSRSGSSPASATPAS